jgi:hypothetical protein
MLTPALKENIRRFVLDFLESLKIKIGPDHSYVDSVQFALHSKADKGHKHSMEDIDGYRFPQLKITSGFKDDFLTVEVTVSKIRGYDMSGAVIGVDWATKEPAVTSLPVIQRFTTGELKYFFEFGQVPVEKYPLMLQAYMKDQNDLDVDVRSSVLVVSFGSLGNTHD